MDVAACLADRRRYERQIERLHQRHLLTGRLYDLRQDGVPLASVVMNRSRVARLLARDVSRGDHRLSPGGMRTFRARGKLREVYTCGLTDLLVHGVVAELVREAVAPTLSERVFSYRAGMSWATPISGFAAWVRAARRAQPDVRRRGVYVLRSDVDSYTDSIPLGYSSPLWAMLEPHLGTPLHPLVRDVISTVIRVPGGGLACRGFGASRWDSPSPRCWRTSTSAGSTTPSAPSRAAATPATATTSCSPTPTPESRATPPRRSVPC